MKITIRKASGLLLIIVLFILCSGCVQRNMDELFRLPEPSKEYIELQHKIDEILSSGAVYSAPASGSHRQSVQLYDISGDGVNEAIAFFNTSGEKPIKIYIFQIVNGKYETASVIEGDGTGIESIFYTDMDSDGWSEIIVGLKISTDIQMLRLYSLKGFQPAAVATTDYTAYTVADIDMNEIDDLVVVRHNSADFGGTVHLYSINEEGETVTSSAQLSVGMERILKLTVGLLSDKSRAVFIEGNFDSNDMITDVFAWYDNKITNISADKDGISRDLARSSTANCRDINGDGVMEIPVPRVLPTQTENVYRVLDWYYYNKWGFKSLALTTYHNYSDSWYLALPSTWGVDITIRREDIVSGERAVVFSIWNGADSPPTDFLKIFTLTGENRHDKANMEGRFVLRQEDEIIYAAELIEEASGWENMPDEKYLKDNFSLIYSEWITGLT